METNTAELANHSHEDTTMAAWLPILKTALPYLTTIVTAVPALNARKDGEHIAELEQAVRDNTESTKTLSEQLQRAIRAIEAGAASAERRIHRAQTLSGIATAIAAVALCVAIVAVWHR